MNVPVTPLVSASKQSRRNATRHLEYLFFATALSMPLVAAAQNSAAIAKPATTGAEQGARWADLKPAQRVALRPLEREWAGIDSQHKAKWLELAARFPKMPPSEQSRIQERMAEWATLTPPERHQARMQFQEAKRFPSPDRQARWEEYQALSPDEKQRLAARAASAASAASASAAQAARKGGAASLRGDKVPGETSQAKSNIVSTPSLAATLKPVAPAVVQARPGATTSPINRRPAPPAHQQAGMPKIAATPEFVDKATLLPQRGPQSAAARPTSPATQPATARP